MPRGDIGGPAGSLKARLATAARSDVAPPPRDLREHLCAALAAPERFTEDIRVVVIGVLERHPDPAALEGLLDALELNDAASHAAVAALGRLATSEVIRQLVGGSAIASRRTSTSELRSSRRARLQSLNAPRTTCCSKSAAWSTGRSSRMPSAPVLRLVLLGD